MIADPPEISCTNHVAGVEALHPPVEDRTTRLAEPVEGEGDAERVAVGVTADDVAADGVEFDTPKPGNPPPMNVAANSATMTIKRPTSILVAVRFIVRRPLLSSALLDVGLGRLRAGVVRLRELDDRHSVDSRELHYPVPRRQDDLRVLGHGRPRLEHDLGEARGLQLTDERAQLIDLRRRQVRRVEDDD